MKIGVLTSSRADYGLYKPLLDLIKEESFFELEVIAFGTNLSNAFGSNITSIINDDYALIHQIDTIPDGDRPEFISKAMGITIEKFSDFWKLNVYDLVFALGDRYEMFSAIASTLPFNIKIAHISGGETTLGAFDNAFRHSITHMSKYHFTSTEEYKQKVISMIGNSDYIYNVGALSIDNLKSQSLLTLEEIKTKFSIDLSIPSILITFHPETIDFKKNESYIKELISALESIKNYQFIITMPNADTMGEYIRTKLNEFINLNDRAFGVESFGMQAYLSCMKYCSMMLGNTSSGFVEASFFPKYVINLGDRQKGRIITENICNIPFKKEMIITSVNNYETISLPKEIKLYGNGETAKKIVEIIKSNFQC